MVRVVRATLKELEQAVTALRDGELVAFPTETVYGLGANAQNPAAVRRIFELKDRPADHPVIVHLDNPKYLHRWASTVPENAQKLAASGTKILMTIGFGAPVFGVFASDNNPRFRDGKPWPSGIADGVGTGEEAGYTIVNARTLFDAGAVVGYCTDTGYDALAGLEHELKSYSVMFSMADIHRIIGPNAARYVGLGDQIGTLEAGKLADIILIDGNPTLNIYEMLKTKVVLKEGKVVIDRR